MGKTFKIILTLLAAFISGIIFTVAAINLLIQLFAGGYLLNMFNEKLPGLLKRDISAQGAAVYLLKAEVVLKGVSIESYEGMEQKPVIFVPAIAVKISPYDLLFNRFVIEKVVFLKPVISAGPGGLSKGDSFISFIASLRTLGAGPRNLFVEKASFVTYSADGASLVILSDFDLAVLNMPAGAADANQKVVVKASARVPSEKEGTIDLSLEFRSLYPKYDFAGELKASDISIPYFTSFLGESDDIKINNGILGIKTNIHCAQNWVTSSSIINVNKLDLDMSSKKIFGIPTDMAIRFLETNDVAFDLPVTGDLFHLKIDFKTASTQVMFKALQGRFKSESFTKRVSESFGEKIGSKLEDIFAKLI